MTVGAATADYQHALEAERTCRNALDDYSREHRPTGDMLATLERATDAAWVELAHAHAAAA